MSSYGFIITEDKISSGVPGCKSAVGTIGPRDCSMSPEEIKAKGVYFRLYDDDDEHYYSGYVVVKNDEDLIAPLLDFGEGYAGCTKIKHRTESGKLEYLVG